MNSLALQAAKHVTTQDARRILKRNIQLPRNVRNILVQKASLPKDIQELAKAIRQRVYNRKGIFGIEQISKKKSLQMAKNILEQKLPLKNRKLLSGNNTRYKSTPLNILLSSAPTRIKLNF